MASSTPASSRSSAAPGEQPTSRHGHCSPWLRLRYLIEFAFARLFVGLICRPPERWALALGAFVGGLAYYALPRRRAIGKANIALAFPEWSAKKRRQVLIASYRHLGKVVVEIARLAEMDAEEIRSRITYAEGSLEVFARHPKAIYFTGHVCNWELLALGHSLHVSPMKLVVRSLDNPLVNRMLNLVRSRAGNGVVERGKDENGIYELMEHLGGGGKIGLLVDQYTNWRNGVMVPFFGKMVWSHRGPTILALRTGAALLPVFIHRNPDKPGHFVIVAQPALEVDGGARLHDRILDLTRRQQQIIEAEIRTRPEEWLWLHRRWKRSTDAPGIYRPHGRRAKRADANQA